MRNPWRRLLAWLAPAPLTYGGGSIRAELIRPDPDQPWVDLVEWQRDRADRRKR